MTWQLELRFGNGAIDSGRIRRGDLVWRTHDPDIDKLVRPYVEAGTPLRKQAVDVRAIAREGAPLVTEWRVRDVKVAVESDTPLGDATNRTVDEEYLREQFGRLGNTPYELAGVDPILARATGTGPAPAVLALPRDVSPQAQSRSSSPGPYRCSRCARQARDEGPRRSVGVGQPGPGQKGLAGGWRQRPGPAGRAAAGACDDDG